MKSKLAKWSTILLCFSMGAAIGGGLYEHIVLVPLWSASPPASFAVIQPGTGVPLQNFWVPVHLAITVFVIVSLLLTWRERPVRRLLLIGLGSYVVMRVWSGIFFIREMLAFQTIPLDSTPTTELLARVNSWRFWTWYREPLDIATCGCWLLALFGLNRRNDVSSGPAEYVRTVFPPDGRQRHIDATRDPAHAHAICEE